MKDLEYTPRVNVGIGANAAPLTPRIMSYFTSLINAYQQAGQPLEEIHLLSSGFLQPDPQEQKITAQKIRFVQRVFAVADLELSPKVLFDEQPVVPEIKDKLLAVVGQIESQNPTGYEKGVAEIQTYIEKNKSTVEEGVRYAVGHALLFADIAPTGMQPTASWGGHREESFNYWRDLVRSSLDSEVLKEIFGPEWQKMNHPQYVFQTSRHTSVPYGQTTVRPRKGQPRVSAEFSLPAGFTFKNFTTQSLPDYRKFLQQRTGQVWQALASEYAAIENTFGRGVLEEVLETGEFLLTPYTS